MFNSNMITKLITTLLILPVGLGSISSVQANTLSSSSLIQLCVAAKESNDMGVSVKPLLRQVFISKGAPAYLANVAMNEMKAYCPKAY